MNTTVEKQFSVFLVNKPGVLGQVCQALAEAKVNIKALTLVDSQEHGVLRVVLEDGERAEKVLRRLNIPMTESDVLCVELANKPGAMADVCNRLASEHVNINYAYCSTGAHGGKTIGVFKTSDIKKAQKMLAHKKQARQIIAVRPRPAGRSS